MNHARTLLALTCALPLAIGFASACSDTSERAGLDPARDASDAAALANLPEAGEPVDAARPAPPFDASAEPVACAVTPCAVELVAGAAHFCARLDDGTVQCWGDDGSGALGGGPFTPPEDDDGGVARGTVRVTDLSDVVQLSAAGTSTCARLASGTVRCWGGNAKGQLGLHQEEPFADGDPHPVPSDVATGPLARVDLGLASACGIGVDGTVRCWGDNAKGQLTRVDVGATSGPVAADLGGLAIVRTAASNETGYALSSDGDVFSWGRIAARPSSLDVDPSPAKVPALAGVHDIAVGPLHACAAANGEVFCWGERDAPLCTGLPDAQLEPKRAPLRGLGRAQQIAVSRNTTCARLTDGSVQCCGADDHGQLGDQDAGARELAFRSVTQLHDHVVHVATADEATCALVQSGSVVCWGGNAHGELGGTTRDGVAHPAPTKVVFR